MLSRREKVLTEWKLAKRLDLAYQLLVFFGLTQTATAEEYCSILHIPAPRPVLFAAQTEWLVVSVFPSDSGEIVALAIGEQYIPSLAQLDRALQMMLSEPSSPFDAVMVQVGSSTRYDEFMKVVDVCAHQRLKDGHPLRNVTFMELPAQVR